MIREVVARVMVGWESPVASTNSLRVMIGFRRTKWRHFAAGVRGRVNTGPGLIIKRSINIPDCFV